MESYRDPRWGQLEQRLAPGLAGFLENIRLNGERSNNSQVSEIGARSVYQISPDTRSRILQKQGFDPWASPENAVRGAMVVAQDAMRWAKGDPAKAAGYYHAGGDTKNWGPRTASYIQRTAGTPMKAQNPFDQFDRPQQSSSQGDNPFDRFDAPEPKKKLRIIDKAVPSGPLDGMNVGERLLVGAGKAGADLLRGVGLDRVFNITPANERADAALLSDPAGATGNIAGQAGLMYVGGLGLRGASAGANAMSNMRNVPTAARAALDSARNGLSAASQAVLNPTTYKQAALAGAGYGAIAQPGDLAERTKNALAGGVGGASGILIGRGVDKFARAAKGMLTPASSVLPQVQAKLQAKGVDFNALPGAVQKQILKFSKQSTEALNGLDAEQLQRMADFEKLGIKPTKGWITRDGKDWWMENTLNTVDNRISGRFREANQELLEGVRDGVSQASDYDIGNKLQDALTGYDAALKAKADRLYSAARDMAGRDIELDPHRFVNAASTELDQQMLGSKLPRDTLKWFRNATGGQEPFTMDTALQRLQAINGRIYSTADPAEAKALGIVKKHLIDAIDGYGGPGAGGLPRVGADPQQELADAFRAARTAAADRFRFQDSSPLVEQVLKGKYAPEKLPDMLGSMKVNDLKSLAALQAQRGVPVLSSLRDAAKVYVRDAATAQAETGGMFNLSGLRKALDRIGPEKGKLLFGEDGWEQYQRLLRVGGAVYNPPAKVAGSPTYSNFMRFVNSSGKLPFGNSALNLATTTVAKARQLNAVQQALNPAFSMRPAWAQSAQHLPLLTTPAGLLSANE